MPRQRKNGGAALLEPPKKSKKEAEREIDNIAADAQLKKLEKEQAEDAQSDDQGEIVEAKIVPEPVTFEAAGDAVEAQINRVIKNHHADMADSGVLVRAVFAKAGKNSKGPKPAITVRGHSQPGKIVRQNEIARLCGSPDAILILDHEQWESSSEKQRDAVIDHYLTSLLVKREGNTEDGEIETDAAGRPKLKPRHADLELTIYKEVIERHHEASPDHRQISKMVDDMRQLVMFPAA